MTKNKFKIAIIAPAFGNIGGPEVVTQNLTNALLEKNIDVTIFAPADWKTKARHIPTLPQSLWHMKDFKNQTEQVRRNLLIISQLKVLNYQNEFDIIHIHSQRYAYAISQLTNKPCVLTFHNKITLPEYKQIKKASNIHLVALSQIHRNKLKNFTDIPNGIETKKINYSFQKGKYLITIGRLAEAKGIDIAIKIAKKTKKKLLIFGRIGNSPKRQSYFNKKIKSQLKNNIIYMGEASQEKIFFYLKNAEALLFPIKSTSGRLVTCPLVVMESLACGTPVIGTHIGPLKKLVNWKKVAFLSNNPKDLIRAVLSLEKFDRKKCREFAEKYFDSSLMAEKYIQLYKKILNQKNNIC